MQVKYSVKFYAKKNVRVNTVQSQTWPCRRHYIIWKTWNNSIKNINLISWIMIRKSIIGTPFILRQLMEKCLTRVHWLQMWIWRNDLVVLENKGILSWQAYASKDMWDRARTSFIFFGGNVKWLSDHNNIFSQYWTFIFLHLLNLLNIY